MFSFTVHTQFENSTGSNMLDSYVEQDFQKLTEILKRVRQTSQLSRTTASPTCSTYLHRELHFKALVPKLFPT